MTTEAERRRKYRDSAVLIESGRVLSPQFEQLVAWFSGAQVEILRNLMQYARLRDSWVSEYESGTYLIPDDADWNDIDAVIADLENVLMGNDNVIWGYSDVYGETLEELPLPAGTSTKYSKEVPAGECWVITGISATVVSTSITRLNLGAYIDATWMNVYGVESPASRMYYVLYPQLRLSQGGRMLSQVIGATAGDTLVTSWWGYKMKVP